MWMLNFFRKRRVRFLGRAGFTFKSGNFIYKINSEMLFDGPFDIAVFPDYITEESNPQAKITGEEMERIIKEAVVELESIGYRVEPDWL